MPVHTADCLKKQLLLNYRKPSRTYMPVGHLSLWPIMNMLGNAGMDKIPQTDFIVWSRKK